MPYLAERFDRGYEAFARCRENITLRPSEYLRRFYYDTVNFDLQALRLAIDFAGVDRILAGSDYPHMIGSLPKMVESIRALNLGPEDEAKVLAHFDVFQRLFLAYFDEVADAAQVVVVVRNRNKPCIQR